jgi:hypothetical protein
MPLEMWFRDDLAGIMRSLNAANAAGARLSNDAETAAYRQGFNEAILAFAIALSIKPENVGIAAQAQTLPGLVKGGKP